MVKLYEGANCIVIDTEKEGLSFPIYIFYQDKIAQVNYMNPITNIISEADEMKSVLKAIILYGRQNNKYMCEIDYYNKFLARNEEDLSKMAAPIPNEDQEVHDIFMDNINAAKERLEKLKFLQEKPINFVIDTMGGVL